MHILRENLVFHFGVTRRFLTVNQVLKKERTPQKSEEERQSYAVKGRGLRENFSIAEEKHGNTYSGPQLHSETM